MSCQRPLLLMVGWVIVCALTGCNSSASSPAVYVSPTMSTPTSPVRTPTPEQPATNSIMNAGSSGIGDPYYDQLGNGGYDVSHYTISLDVDPSSNMMSGTTIIDAKATQLLDSMNLDLQDLTVDAVQVNSEPAIFSHQDHELKISPYTQLVNGELFSIHVLYHGNPKPIENIASQNLANTVGWFHSTTGAIIVWSEPNGSASWFPVNDHPRDKATYRFEITVPKPWVVAASGILSEVVDNGSQTRYVWEMDQPMASYLASIEIDKYIIETSAGPNGIVIRNYFTPDFPTELKANINQIPAMIAYFSSIFGQYPFGAYGVVISEGDIPPCNLVIGGATELQSLSLFCPKDSVLDESIIAHELAHQWFGSSVSLKNWQDLWLKEGMATYAEWLWQTRNQGVEALNQRATEERSSFSIDNKIGQPPPEDLYSWEQYGGGALTIHALRLKVGDEVFFKIIRTYLERYRYGNASVQDFIDLSEEISGLELSAFFDDWLNGTKVPDFPEPSK